MASPTTSPGRPPEETSKGGGYRKGPRSSPVPTRKPASSPGGTASVSGGSFILPDYGAPDEGSRDPTVPVGSRCRCATPQPTSVGSFGWMQGSHCVESRNRRSSPSSGRRTQYAQPGGGTPIAFDCKRRHV